ncbi:unnamed protein product [Leptidea sinapis]|uniref:Uncharacterized protein n=1 Tax=Leptidea sinapis TaxID=189913 RepID=A0A5E4QYX2_9NEOP|nr:unnamed protein product [Leptidea sinapis]
MLDLEIIPERSLGSDAWEFVLGMHFSQAVAIIQSQVGTIRGVQVLYSDQSPLSVDLVINMPQDGVRLIFDPVAQRLKIIEIYNMKLITPSIEQVEHCFGATHPGLYDSQRHLFALNFRGLTFYFPVDSKFEAAVAGVKRLWQSCPCPATDTSCTSAGVTSSGAPPPPWVCGYTYTQRGVARSLAAPARLYYKADDKMRIHRPTARRRAV